LKAVHDECDVLVLLMYHCSEVLWPRLYTEKVKIVDTYVVIYQMKWEILCTHFLCFTPTWHLCYNRSLVYAKCVLKKAKSSPQGLEIG